VCGYSVIAGLSCTGMVTLSLDEICVVREACKVLVTSVNVKYGV
jgi:hypothetical protein